MTEPHETPPDEINQGVDPITPVLTRRWLSPRAWDIDTYEQLEGYSALRYGARRSAAASATAAST